MVGTGPAKEKKIRDKIFILSLTFLISLTGVAFAQTQVIISPSTKEIFPEMSFSIDISVTPDTEIAGAQFDLTFDADLIQTNSVQLGK